MLKKIKETLYQCAKSIIPCGMFDFLWNKYYISNIKRNCTQLSPDSYYVKNENDINTPNYCIFRFGIGIGLFAMANKMLFYYEWAEKNGFIPLVDSEYEEDFLKGKFGEDNLWEYCFCQPESVKQAFDKGNVLVSSINGGGVLQSTCKKINDNVEDAYIHAKKEGYHEYYARLHEISKRVWKFSPEVEKEVERAITELFRPEMRVMGVILREEFGKSTKMTEEQRAIYKSHPEALSIEETYQLIIEYMKKWNCTHVLITTMFQESLEYFKKKLGDKVIYIKRERKDYNKNFEAYVKTCEDIIKNNGRNIKKLHCENGWLDQKKRKEGAIGYAVEMSAVAKCNYCMGVACSGLTAACILNGGEFEDIYIFEDRNKCSRY